MGMVLEMVPETVAAHLTEALAVPTIGIAPEPIATARSSSGRTWPA